MTGSGGGTCLRRSEEGRGGKRRRKKKRWSVKTRRKKRNDPKLTSSFSSFPIALSFAFFLCSRGASIVSPSIVSEGSPIHILSSALRESAAQGLPFESLETERRRDEVRNRTK